MFYGQYEQDKFVRETFFPHHDTGLFLDVGAEDGVDKSNTKFFEEVGWTGICIEPSPSRFAALAHNRRCECLNVAIASLPGDVEFMDITGYGKGLSGIVAHYDPRHVERIARETTGNPLTRAKCLVRVPALRLDDVLDRRGITRVNYCSIDVEGSESDVLASINWSAVVFDVITIEDNYGDSAVTQILAAHGYRCVATIGQDLVFAHPAMPAG